LAHGAINRRHVSGTQSGCSVAGPLLHRRVLSCPGVGLSVRFHVVSSCRHDFWSCHFCAVARSFSRQFRQMCCDSSDATTARQKTCFRCQARARWVWQWHSGPHRMCRWYSRFLHGQPRTSRIAIPAQPLQLTLRNVYVWDTRRTHHCTRLAIQYFRRWELRTNTCGLEKTDPTRKSSLHNAAMGARVPCHQKCQYLRSKVPLPSDSGRQDTPGNCGTLNHDTIDPRTRVTHEPQYRDTTRCYYFCIDSTCLFAMMAWHTQLSYPSEPLSKTRETNSGRRYPDV